MKSRLIFSVCLIVFALCVSISSIFITKTICENIETQVKQTQEYIKEDNQEQALNLAKNISDKWKNQYKILCTFIPHDELERCEISINAMKTYLCIGDLGSALIICEDIKLSSNHIYINEYPGFWNIF